MKLKQLLPALAVLVAGLLAAPAVFAHATYNDGGTGASPVWANGAPTEWMASTATLPSIGYLGIHSLSNARVIQTGVNNYANAATYSDTVNATGVHTQKGPTGATTADLGGVFHNITPVVGDSLLGQVNKNNYNASLNVPGYSSLSTSNSISVGGNSWNGGNISLDGNNALAGASSGLSFGNIHASAGSGSNLELNAMNLGPSATGAPQAFQYVNVWVGGDGANAASEQLAFSIYQGWAQGPGLQGLHYLGSVAANTAGQDIGMTIALTGNSLYAGGAGEYTIVVGNQSSVAGNYKIGLQASTIAAFTGNLQVAAVPVPGAVWLFGSAIAGLIGIGRRKATVMA